MIEDKYEELGGWIMLTVTGTSRCCSSGHDKSDQGKT